MTIPEQRPMSASCIEGFMHQRIFAFGSVRRSRPTCCMSLARAAAATQSKTKKQKSSKQEDAKEPEKPERIRLARFEDEKYIGRAKAEAYQIGVEKLSQSDPEQKPEIARRQARKTSGVSASTDAEFERMVLLISEGVARGQPCLNVPMFCDSENPQWFAVQVASPEPKQAAKVAKLLEQAKDRLPPVVLPSGKAVPRELETWNPKKKVKAFSLRSRKMGSKMVTWKNGSFVFFKAIMDPELAMYLQPWFEDPSEYWWRRLRRPAREAVMVAFENGELVLEHFQVPRPCPQELLDEARQWVETPEEWGEKEVLYYEFGNNTPSDFATRKDVTEADAYHMKKWNKVVERSGGRGLDVLEKERLTLKGLLNTSLRDAQSSAAQKQLNDLQQQDAGGWNVGGVSFQRQRHSSKGRQQQSAKQGFNRTKFASEQPPPAPPPPQRQEGPAYASGSSRLLEAAASERGQRRARGAAKEDEVAIRSGWFARAGDDNGWSAEDDSWLTGQVKDDSHAMPSDGLREASSASSDEELWDSWTNSTASRSAADEDLASEASSWQSSTTRGGSKSQQPGESYGGRGKPQGQDSRARERTPQEDGWHQSWYEAPSESEEAGSTEGGWYTAAAAARDQYSRPDQASGSWYTGDNSAKPDASTSEGKPVPFHTWNEESLRDIKDELDMKPFEEVDMKLFEEDDLPALQDLADLSDEDDNDVARAWQGVVASGEKRAKGADLSEPMLPKSKGVTSTNAEQPVVGFNNARSMEGSSQPASRSTVSRLHQGSSDSPRPPPLSASRQTPTTSGRRTQFSEGRIDGSRSRNTSNSQRQQPARYDGIGRASEPKLRQTRARSEPKAERRQRTALAEEFDWDNEGSPSQGGNPVPADFQPGDAVSIQGGRFKEQKGSIVSVRSGVVRVSMQGEEGPVEADIAAAYCSRA